MHFLIFAPAQPCKKKGTLFVAKALMFLFTGNVLGKTCGMQPQKFCSHCPLSGQGPAPVFRKYLYLKKQNHCLYHGDSQWLQIMARIPFGIQDTGPNP